MNPWVALFVINRLTAFVRVLASSSANAANGYKPQRAWQQVSSLCFGWVLSLLLITTALPSEPATNARPAAVPHQALTTQLQLKTTGAAEPQSATPRPLNPEPINHQSMTRYLRRHHSGLSALTQRQLTAGHLFSATVLNQQFSPQDLATPPVRP